jgi:hypothetical protein
VQLVLTIILLFILVGLLSRTFRPRQQVVIATVAVTLALMQFTFSRFL